MNNAVPSMHAAFVAIIRRDLLLALRRKGDIANPLIFALIVISLFPLGLGPEAGALKILAPGLVWVVALLACLLSLDSMFKSDFEDGSLEQLVLSPQPIYLMAMAKVVAHWLVAGLPVALLSPLLGIMLALPSEGYLALMLSLLVGTMGLSLIGGIGAALTVGLRGGGGGLLVALLVLPLYVPILIFGVSTVYAAVQGIAFGGYIAMLGGFTMLALILSPFAIAGGLKIHLES
ncbi:MAG: heme exporter protein B [Pseudomonadales bacterium]|jgi:heme exporter protein B